MVDFNKIKENISKLSGDWKTWAKEADEKADTMGGKKDGIFLNSAFEIDYVKNKALSSGLKQKDVASVFQNLGIEAKETQEIMDGTFFKNAKKELKTVYGDAKDNIIRNYITDAGKSFVKNGNWDDLANSVKDKIENETHTNPEYYEQLKTQVDQVLNEFKKVTESFNNGEFNSRAEVVGLFNRVAAAFADNNDEFKEFRAELIETFGTLAEARQLQKETDLVNNRFTELVKTMSREEALNQVKTEFKDKGSYYNDFDGFSVKEINHQDELYKDEAGRTIRPHHKGILADMEDKIVLQHASDEVDKIIQELKKEHSENDENLSSKDIENAAIAKLKEKGTYDRFAKKYMRGRTEMSTGEILSFEKSPYKLSRKNAAAARRAQAIIEKPFTYTELRKKSKSDNTFVERLLNKEVTLLDEKGNPVVDENGEYVKVKAFTKNEDDTYNISGLSMFIRRTIGKDLMGSAEPSKINVYDEISNVARGLGVSKKDAKNLIKMCGYDIESNNWAKIFMDAFVDTLIGSIPGTAVATLGLASNVGSQIVAGQTVNFVKEFMVAHLEYKNSQSWTIDINIDGTDVEFDEEVLLTQLKTQAVNYTYWDDDMGTFVTTKEPLLKFLNYEIDDGKLKMTFNKPNEGEINLFGKVDEDQTTPDRKAKDAGIDAKKSLPVQLLKSFAISFAINLLREALKTQGTTPILSPDFDKTLSLDDYIEMNIKNNDNIKDPKLKAALITLVNNFVTAEFNDKGELVKQEWDKEAYSNMLSTIAGPNSHLTATELYDYLKEIIPTVDDEKPVAPKKESVEPVVVEKPKEYETKKDVTLASSYTPSTTEFNAWKDIVNGYDCLNNPEYNVTVQKPDGKKVMLNNRMVKILQAIDLTKVDKNAKIQDVYNLDVIANFAKRAIESDIDTAMQEFPDFPIDKDKYNDVVYASGGVKGDVVVPELYDDDGNQFEWTDKGKSAIKKGGKVVVTVTTTTRTINGETHYYKREKGSDGDWIEIEKDEFDKLQ